MNCGVAVIVGGTGEREVLLNVTVELPEDFEAEVDRLVTDEATDD